MEYRSFDLSKSYTAAERLNRRLQELGLRERSPETIVKVLKPIKAAVAVPYEELQHALADQPVLNGDETGHRTNGAKRWLWTLVAPTFVFYAIATSRSADVLRQLLGAAFSGVLGSDRLPVYLTYAAARRQLCWSHFTRNLLNAQDLATTTAAKPSRIHGHRICPARRERDTSLVRRTRSPQR